MITEGCVYPQFPCTQSAEELNYGAHYPRLQHCSLLILLHVGQRPRHFIDKNVVKQMAGEVGFANVWWLIIAKQKKGPFAPDNKKIA